LKFLLKYSLLFLLAFSSLSFQQQQSFDPNTKVKAVFLYNFTKYFEWPDKMKSGNFIIQVIGSNVSLNQELTKMTSTKQKGNQKLELIISSALEPGLKPHIVYLLAESSDLLKDAMQTKLQVRAEAIAKETGIKVVTRIGSGKVYKAVAETANIE
jgi:hypothetical protein